MSLDLEEIEIDKHQFTLANCGLSDFHEYLQYINRFVSQFMCIWLHLSIICRLFVVNNFRVKSDYQILIIAQSAINIAACAFDVIVNEIQTQNGWYIKIGHPFWQLSMNERLFYIIGLTVFSTSSQDILMLFNLHRLFIIKKKSLVILYAIAIPLMLIGPIGDAYTAVPVIMAGRDNDLFFKQSQIVGIAVIIIICYVKLNKEFATNPSFSEKTKRLQQKLSWSILMQLTLLCVILFILKILPWAIENLVDYSIYERYEVTFIIYALVITQWYSFLSAVFIAWSIAGFFKNPTPPTTKQHSDSKIFQVEPQRKQSVKTAFV
ncbi:hypothetical protein GCK72_021796 [Caenorhabditis remanei]|uniref:G-protein coupled receptors family 1 profile domain-containing protein n=1 Tax=Caenorhabditis remanei TaxID=31234 RepID=A0A6A5GJ21_CAERE|nr:hypothetical protein GCK72_021796 [Caenorhabditis remanei]KAF1755227.1 hypothetical protein GCK72_021796 [Caenorhabditis remanei]